MNQILHASTSDAGHDPPVIFVDNSLLADADDTSTSLQGCCVLLVLTGSIGRRRLLSRIQSLGVRVVCYAPATNWASQYIPDQDWILGPLSDHAAAQAAVQAWLQGASQASEHQQRRHLDAVLCYDEYGLQLAAHLAATLELPHTSVSAMATVRSKLAFREACAQAGLPCPRFLRLGLEHTSPAALAQQLSAAGMQFPVVVKPTCLAGSFAVCRVDTLDQLAAAAQRFYQQQLPQYAAAQGLSLEAVCAQGGMIVEELLVGQEVDIDCVTLSGRLLFACVSDNHPASGACEGARTFMETGGRCPSALPQSSQASLLCLARDVVRAVGPGLSGVLHFEAMLTPQGPVPIELNARVGGAETYSNIKAAWGVDLAEAAVLAALGRTPRLPPNLVTALRVRPMTGVVSTHILDSFPEQCVSVGHTTSSLQGCGQHLQSDPAVKLDAEQMQLDSVDTVDALQQPPSGQAAARPSFESSAASSDTCAATSHHLLQSDMDTLTTISTAPGSDAGSLCICSCTGSSGCSCSCTHQCLRSASGGFLSTSDDEGPSLLCQTCTKGNAGKQAQEGSQAAWALSLSRPAAAALTSRGSVHHVGHDSRLRVVAPLCYLHSVNFVPDWQGPGVLSVLQLEPSTADDPAYVDSELYYKPGDKVLMPPAGYSALGWMVAAASEGPQAAEAAMQRLMQGVTIHLRACGESA